MTTLQEEFKKYSSIDSTSSYNKLVAKQLALFCALVYRTDDKKFVEDLLVHWGCQMVKLFDNQGTEAMCIKKDNNIILSFRGTEPNELADILADINIIPKKASNEKQGLVHSGFALALDKIWPRVQSFLDSIYEEGNCIYICGHSLGGALATVAAARSKYLCQVYTYGQPRVGSSKYSKNVKSTLYRHIRGCDIVPSVPLPIVYYHMGDIKVVDRHTKTVYDVHDYIRLGGIRFLQFMKNIISPSKYVGDHDILGYYTDIN